jgi:hypothetical protein
MKYLLCVALALAAASANAQTLSSRPNSLGGYSYSDGSWSRKNAFGGHDLHTAPTDSLDSFRNSYNTKRAIEDAQFSAEHRAKFQRDAEANQRQEEQQMFFQQQMAAMQWQARMNANAAKAKIERNNTVSNADRRRVERAEELKVRREKAAADVKK